MLISQTTLKAFYWDCCKQFGNGLGGPVGTIGPIGGVAIAFFFAAIILTIVARKKKKRFVAGLIVSILDIIFSAAWWYLWVYSAGRGFLYE